MSSYQVLFSGEIAEGATEEVVRANLARTLSIDDRKLTQLFSGRIVVLKSRLNQSQAEALQAQLSDLGAISRIRDLAPDKSKSAFKIDNRDPDTTLKDLTAAHVACPRCGHMQLDAEFCARCGANVNELQLQQNKEDLIIAKKIRELRANRREAAVDDVGDDLRDAGAHDEEEPLPLIETHEPTETRGDVPNPFSRRSGLKRWFKRRS